MTGELPSLLSQNCQHLVLTLGELSQLQHVGFLDVFLIGSCITSLQREGVALIPFVKKSKYLSHRESPAGFIWNFSGLWENWSSEYF